MFSAAIFLTVFWYFLGEERLVDPTMCVFSHTNQPMRSARLATLSLKARLHRENVGVSGSAVGEGCSSEASKVPRSITRCTPSWSRSPNISTESARRRYWIPVADLHRLSHPGLFRSLSKHGCRRYISRKYSDL